MAEMQRVTAVQLVAGMLALSMAQMVIMLYTPCYSHTYSHLPILPAVLYCWFLVARAWVKVRLERWERRETQSLVPPLRDASAGRLQNRLERRRGWWDALWRELDLGEFRCNLGRSRCRQAVLGSKPVPGARATQRHANVLMRQSVWSARLSDAAAMALFICVVMAVALDLSWGSSAALRPLWLLAPTWALTVLSFLFLSRSRLERLLTTLPREPRPLRSGMAILAVMAAMLAQAWLLGKLRVPLGLHHASLEPCLKLALLTFFGLSLTRSLEPEADPDSTRLWRASCWGCGLLGFLTLLGGESYASLESAGLGSVLSSLWMLLLPTWLVRAGLREEPKPHQPWAIDRSTGTGY